jgi:HD domain
MIRQDALEWVVARESGLLLERISRLRKGFEEARACGKALIPNVVCPSNSGLERPPLSLALGELLQTVSGSEVDSLPSPTYLTQGMRQLLARAGQISERLHWVAADQATPRGLSKGSAVAALGAIVRSVATLPDSVTVQDLRLEGLQVQLMLLEQLAEDLEASQANGISRRRQLVALARLLGELHAVALREGNSIPEPNRLEPIVAKVLELARRDTWREDGLCIPAETLNDTAMLVAADGWNVALVMARACLRRACPSGVELEEVVLAGLLHDVGMLGIPETQMKQVEPWSAAERGVMENHARQGAHILEKWLPGAAAARGMALWHHERPDGTGYPDALLLAEIPELARLGSVVDMVCGLLLPRGNRPAIAWSEAVNVALRSAAVGLLDPEWAGVVAGLVVAPSERLDP